jgi:8-oxo-dGTP pyrophosphatase MutT (NUDIX family)
MRAAALIIKDNKLLMVKNTDFPCYYTVGGGIEPNETSDEAVIREVYEETSYHLEIDRLAFIQERFYEVNQQKRHEIVFFYLMKEKADINIPDGSFTDQPPKATLHWLPIDKLSEINIAPEFLKTKSFDNITGIEHIISRD